jgi:hypothetical protein
MRKTANAIYQAIKDDSSAVAEVRAEYKALAKEVATSPSGGQELTSATVNGQSFSSSTTMSKIQRLKMLAMLIRALDQEAPISNQTIPTF